MTIFVDKTLTFSNHILTDFRKFLFLMKIHCFITQSFSGRHEIYLKLSASLT